MKKHKTAGQGAKRRRPYRETAGLPPGSLVHTGDRKTEGTRITLMTYSEAGFEEREIGPDGLPGPDCDGASVQWLNVEGIADISVMEAVGKKFGLHRLVLEDILNTGQRPKIEDYRAYLYVVVKVLSGGAAQGDLVTEQESFILGDGFLITFGERDTDLFAPVIERIRGDMGRLRRLGADYLLYALLDVVVDQYFVVLEELGEGIENAEDGLVTRPTSGMLAGVHRLKRQMLFLHKAVWPMREVVGALERGETRLMGEGTAVYLRDLYDHVIQAMDIVDTQRDILSGLLDLYLSSASNRMNEIMKVLTIISTIFMPLSFIVGLYGMNLIMPETRLPWAYPAVLGVLAAAALGMLAFFRRKKWL